MILTLPAPRYHTPAHRCMTCIRWVGMGIRQSATALGGLRYSSLRRVDQWRWGWLSPAERLRGLLSLLGLPWLWLGLAWLGLAWRGRAAWLGTCLFDPSFPKQSRIHAFTSPEDVHPCIDRRSIIHYPLSIIHHTSYLHHPSPERGPHSMNLALEAGRVSVHLIAHEI